jgi:hypothetical protein
MVTGTWDTVGAKMLTGRACSSDDDDAAGCNREPLVDLPMSIDARRWMHIAGFGTHSAFRS